MVNIVIDRCHHVDGNYDGGKHLQVLEVREGHSRGQFRGFTGEAAHTLLHSCLCSKV